MLIYNFDKTLNPKLWTLNCVFFKGQRKFVKLKPEIATKLEIYLNSPNKQSCVLYVIFRYKE